MWFPISTFVLLLSALALSALELRHINHLTDDVLARLRTRYGPFLELDDIKVVSRLETLRCLNGTGSSLASLHRHGHARQAYEYSFQSKVWANIELEPFTFRFTNCVIINGTEFKFIGPLGGSTMFSSGLMQLKVRTSNDFCITSFTHFGMHDLMVVFDEAYGNSTIFQRFGDHHLRNAVKEDIISSVNLTLADFTGIEFKNSTC